MGCCQSAGVCLEPIVPCCCSCMTGCHDGVVWRSESAFDMGLVALTIDDSPRMDMTLDEVDKIMLILHEHDQAKATFFFIWTILDIFLKNNPIVARYFLDKIRTEGHEVGVHFDGRWGCTKPTAEFTQEAETMINRLNRDFRIELKYARPPGGFATHKTVSALEKLKLTTVIGTAYPFDVDLCRCLSAKRLGTCAAAMGHTGGRIVILHDRKDLIPKLKAYLNRAVRQDGLEVVTLKTMLDNIRNRPRYASHKTAVAMPALHF